jgi:hypothetical protein
MRYSKMQVMEFYQMLILVFLVEEITLLLVYMEAQMEECLLTGLSALVLPF